MTTVTMRDVAREAGVSVGTVSRVLNDHLDVAPGLRRRVLLSAADLGYSRGSCPVPRGEGLDIAFLLALRDVERAPRQVGSFWMEIMRGAEEEARRNGARLAYQALPRSGAGGAVAALAAPQALLVGPSPDWALAELQGHRIPTVLVDNAAGGRAPAVLSDDFGGAVAAVEHLLALGHRDIAFIGGPPGGTDPATDSIHTIEWRAMGYRAALARHGLPAPAGLQEHCDLTPAGGQAATHRLLRSGHPFSAVFCANDPTALGALRALAETGRQVPADVSVMGFDHQSGLAQHRLSTVRVDRLAVGATAVRVLLELLAHPDRPAATTVLPTTLQPGGTVAPAFPRPT